MSRNAKLFFLIFLGMLLGFAAIVLGFHWVMDGVWYGS